ncbi:MAG TPA: glycosyltransferase [Candidatus Sulfotelmatobacter sp.]|nr:glycosyltransferase [Candidatus Sulfotelmatobacter sp.]
MIPKIIHRIWFGPNAIPAQYEEWWQGWQRQLPSYEFITWTDRHIGELASAPLIMQADSMAKRADIARYEIMHKFGGTYLDCDFMPLNYFDFSAEQAELVICHESEVPEVNCSNGFYSIVKGHPMMLVAMEMVEESNSTAKEVIAATGPGFFGRLIRTVKHKRMPSRSFYPYIFNEPFSDIYTRNLDNTYGIHVWHNSWFNDDLRLRKINSMILKGSLFEIERLWREMGALQEKAQHVPAVIATMRRARESMIELAMTTILTSQIDRTPRPEFELFKACHYHYGQNPKALVWQIGAGNGVAEDPLRPVLVNFDPPALLVEANPYLAAELQANYANNRNCRIINTAVGAQAGRAHLYCLNPNQLRQAGGTDEQLNMSSRFSDGRTSLGQACTEDFTKHTLLKSMELADVPVVDFDMLLSMSGGQEPEVLVINIGGTEDELVNAAFDRGLQPKILRFNTRFMPEEALEALRRRFHGEYELFAFDGYHMAYRNDFLINYCSELFVEHGLPTMFAKSMGIIAGLQ